MISEEVGQQFPVAAAIEAQNSEWITGGAVHAGQLVLYIQPSAIVDVCRFLKQQFRCRLSGVTGVDWYPLEPRFEVVYLLHSIQENFRIRLKVRVGGEVPEVESVCSVWEGANWYEREVFDLFGVRFANHPDLTRIMMPDDWEGHPLRKDFPITGRRYSYSDEGNVL